MVKINISVKGIKIESNIVIKVKEIKIIQGINILMKIFMKELDIERNKGNIKRKKKKLLRIDILKKYLI